MRKIVIKYTFRIATVALWGVILLIIFLKGWDSFFNTFFSGFATLVSAWALLAVYYVQKWDTKSGTAQILLNEVRAAERSINELKKRNIIQFEDLNKILPVNSWARCQHEFINDLDEDEFNLINDFYNKCSIVNENIGRIIDGLVVSNNEKRKLTQQIILELSKLHKEDKDKYEEDKRKIFDLFSKEILTFNPDVEINTIQRYLPQIQFITASSCGNKLKKIARMK